MAKYTKKQLKEMAIETLDALNAGDIRAGLLIAHLGSIFKINQNAVYAKIQELANQKIEE